MSTVDPRDAGWTIGTGASGYSDLIHMNGFHIASLTFGALDASTTEIWFERSYDSDEDNCVGVYLDDCKGNTDRLKITVPTGLAETGFSVNVPPSYFGGWDYARLQATDGTDPVQQSAECEVEIGGRDYR